MKLDRKNSIKNTSVDGLNEIDYKINKVKLQNGAMYLGTAIIGLGVFDSIYNIISMALKNSEPNVAHMLLNILVMAFGSVAIERFAVKVNSNQKALDGLEKDYELTYQAEQASEMLEKNPRIR